MSDKLADRTKELMENFKALDGEDVPPEIEALDNDPSEENQKKAGHAYKKMRDFSRTAVSVIQELQGELQSKEEKPSPPQQPGQPVDLAQQGMLIEQQLITAAMQKTGIADPNHPIVQREADALYLEQRQYAEQLASAEATAAEAFGTVVAEFESFTDEDKASIQERLSQVPAIERTADRIKKECYAYQGENLDRFAASKKPAENGDKPDAGAAAAAISSAKKGVAPGEGSPQTGEGKAVKAATQEERAAMKGLPLDPNVPHDVAIFRRAQKKKSKYEPQ